jgi:myo-inositol-1(or 4)-monophosphatase
MIRSPIITVMVQAARKAARALVRDFGEVENLQVSLKGPANFVSAADRRAEEILQAELSKARPNFGFQLEERGCIEGKDKSHRWVVDPLDGTTNFLHGIPLFAISIALVRDGIPIAGLVYNPISDEMYIAERGKGAFLNEHRLRVAARRELSDCVICCGIPHRGRGDLPLFRKELAAVQERVAGLRRTGAAAIDLAWVAAGRFDGFWERDLSPWDLAAGHILVREAGGYITDLDGGDAVLTKGTVLAGNEEVHRALLPLLKSA